MALGLVKTNHLESFALEGLGLQPQMIIHIENLLYLNIYILGIFVLSNLIKGMKQTYYENKEIS